MILSHGRRYIFIHAPKTGGTSLALVLEARAMKDDILLGDTPKAVRRRKRVKQVPSCGRLWKHSTLRDIDGLVSPDRLGDYFVITLVRNPWDRMVSYYHWLKAQNFDHPAVGLAHMLGFSEFLNHRFTRNRFRDEPFGSYVTDARGQEKCDLFARLEHLPDDLARFEAHLGFSLRPLPHVNRSERAADYRGYYNDRDAALLADICATDIERFGYSF